MHEGMRVTTGTQGVDMFGGGSEPLRADGRWNLDPSQSFFSFSGSRSSKGAPSPASGDGQRRAGSTVGDAMDNFGARDTEMRRGNAREGAGRAGIGMNPGGIYTVVCVLVQQKRVEKIHGRIGT